MRMDPFQLYHFVQLVGGLLLLGWIAALAWRWSSHTAKLRYDLQMKVLDRFNSEEFVALLRTEEGRRWMADVLSGHSDPQELVDASLRQAIVLTFLGLGLLAIAKVVESRFLLVSGILIVSGAAGLWMATWVVARRRRTRREIGPS